jgi:hypothetical protein
MRRASIELLIVTDFAMVENPFCGPLMKVGRANTHIAELAAIVDAY